MSTAVENVFALALLSLIDGSPAGEPGPPGDPGDAGPTGDRGSTGHRGFEGVRGPPGIIGSPGEPYYGGPVGWTGWTGNTGSKGDVGMVGPPGKTGDTGATGHPSSDLPGPPATFAPSNTTTTIGLQRTTTTLPKCDSIGPPGPTGATGATGATGMTGDPGMRGTKGEDGSPGLPGSTGAGGPDGAPGVMGAIGEWGQPGPPGPQGDTGATGPTQYIIRSKRYACRGSKGPKGMSGRKGVTGVAGAAGATGDAGNLGAPGIKGMASLYGTGLGNPGQPGYLGAPGDEGTTGPRGSQGATGATGVIIMASPEVDIVRPLFGPQCGGTKVTIIGRSLSRNFNVQVLFGNQSVAIPPESRSDNLLIVTTPSFDYCPNTSLRINILFNNVALCNMDYKFYCRANPTFSTIEPTNHLVVGGTLVTAIGTHMDSVAEPFITLTVVVTRFVNNTLVVTNETRTSSKCRMPVVELPMDFATQLWDTKGNISDPQSPGVAVCYGPNGRDRADIYVGLQLDGCELYRNISAVNPQIKLQFYLSPDLSCNLEGVRSFDQSNDKIISITGENFLRGSHLSDFVTTIGDGLCENVNLTDNQLDCKPPQVKPNRSNSSLCETDSLSVDIAVGFAQYNDCYCMQYANPRNTGSDTTKSTDNVPLIAGLVVGLGVPLILCALVAAYCIWQRRRDEKMKMASDMAAREGRKYESRNEAADDEQYDPIDDSQVVQSTYDVIPDVNDYLKLYHQASVVQEENGGYLEPANVEEIMPETPAGPNLTPTFIVRSASSVPAGSGIEQSPASPDAYMSLSVRPHGAGYTALSMPTDNQAEKNENDETEITQTTSEV